LLSNVAAFLRCDPWFSSHEQFWHKILGWKDILMKQYYDNFCPIYFMECELEILILGYLNQFWNATPIFWQKVCFYQSHLIVIFFITMGVRIACVMRAYEMNGFLKSFLTSYILSIKFWGSWGSSKNFFSLKSNHHKKFSLPKSVKHIVEFLLLIKQRKVQFFTK
jgi:hypothetical protein